MTINRSCLRRLKSINKVRVRRLVSWFFSLRAKSIESRGRSSKHPGHTYIHTQVIHTHTYPGHTYPGHTYIPRTYIYAYIHTWWLQTRYRVLQSRNIMCI